MQLKTEHISIGHKDRALVTEIQTELQPGMCVALMGINGSGKSTLLRTLSGLQAPLQGRVLVNQQNLFDLPVKHRSSQFSMVRPGIEFPGLCLVNEFVLSGTLANMNWTGLHDHEDYINCTESLKTVGILHLQKRYMSSLSDGERQKAAIARSLMANTPFVFLDEPVSFLDIPGKRDIMKMIQQLAHTEKAVLYSSHDMETSVSYSSHIWLIKDNVLITGTTAEMTPVVHAWFNP